jgi:hypothetical protein
VGSRRYRAFEERLISRETLKELEQGGTLPIAVDADFERFITPTVVSTAPELPQAAFGYPADRRRNVG